MATRALIFDFNGTLSDDEPILCEIFIHLFAEHGKPLSAQEYFDELAGLSDPEIVRTWLGHDHPDVDAVIAERVERYRAAVAGGSSVPERVRLAVRYAAERVPLAICSGAAHAEIEPVVEASGLEPLFRGIVAADDVVEGKPHPEGYRKALELLRVKPDNADAQYNLANLLYVTGRSEEAIVHYREALPLSSRSMRSTAPWEIVSSTLLPRRSTSRTSSNIWANIAWPDPGTAATARTGSASSSRSRSATIWSPPRH